MKTEKLDGVMESAYGKKLDTPIKYSGSFEAYENKPEVVAANDLPSDDEVVSFRNTQRRNAARQKFMQAALDAAGIAKPTLETSEELRIKAIVDSLTALPVDKGGKTVEEATVIAKAALGIA